MVFLDSVIYNSTGLFFVVLGTFVLIRATGFPDLTIDGSFTIGAALYAVVLANGYGVIASLLTALLGGGIGGAFTWFVNDRLGVGKVVSGVLSMIILTLTAPYVAGGTTTSLLRVETIWSDIAGMDSRVTAQLLDGVGYRLHYTFSVVVIVGFILVVLAVRRGLFSRVGTRLRYQGSTKSARLVPSGERRVLLLTGLCMGNSLVAVGGAIEAQRRGGFTNNMGVGMVLVALTVLILGEALLKSYRRRDFLTVDEYIVGVIAGTLIYSSGVFGLLSMNNQIVDIRLLTAILLVILLGIAGRIHSSSARLF